MLSSSLHATTEYVPLAGLDRLAEHLPTAWIEEALAATGTASIGRRRLPAEQVVWLVIALALYRGQSMPLKCWIRRIWRCPRRPINLELPPSGGRFVA